MNISLTKSSSKDAEIIHTMQIKSFMPLLEKYQDYETSPVNEPIEKIIDKINQSFTDYYIIKSDSLDVGGVRIVKKNDKRYRVSPIFILPKYQGKGIAQKVFQILEQMYSDANEWELDTILQEQGNCHLYEKVGYKQTGEMKVINDRLTLVFYKK
ncbi:GNAT family N-acetyltransferase [Clostridium psychrophilum]|uniref:GNAT family N-acetyltransferase n=1 Tax=Clostridium psychrophilum TaxID=132926 RepID=UPI001C0E3D12|nr:GNAT family N-acetyltransferase [Clostridium psychrophilum]MBU3179713.1 GNAT family N-acetyltransferase [Clostridium psychrophilum]